MENRACAYSFLNELSSKCDYEIQTDVLCSMIAESMHYVNHIDKNDLQRICEIVYHANGSIRAKMAITQQDYDFVSSLYDKYYVEMKKFVLPQGTKGSTKLHVIRSECKKIVRIIVKIKQENVVVDEIIYNLFNLLSNTFFMMVLYENKHDNFEEIIFVSKSYEC